MSVLFGVGILVACFVAYNVGGATTGPAFGPAVGAKVLSKVAAAGFMSLFFALGAWTIGRRVVDTLGRDLIRDSSQFTLESSIIILFFIGGALLIGNLSGAPSSTSMTAVGAIGGFGLAIGELNFAVIGEIVSWWLISPVLGFWITVMIGRYLYPWIDRIIAIDQSSGPLLAINRTGLVPRVHLGENTTPRELIGSITVIAIGCLMAFSSGASNIANAIAPLVGSGILQMNTGILIGSAAVTIGSFTIARRTLETLGNDITDLPLTAAIIVAVVSSVIVVILSWIAVPASFVIIATLCIVGLGWGRASRAVTLVDAVRYETLEVSVGGLSADPETPTIGAPSGDNLGERTPRPIGNESMSDIPPAGALFDRATTVRVVMMQNLVPVLATASSYVVFSLLS
jgi:PiT family inorganic phosphate transporter